MSRISPRPTRVDRDPSLGYEIRYNQHPNRKNNLKVGEMYDAYKDGMSMRTIGKLYGCTGQAVGDIFRRRGYRVRAKKLLGARTVEGVLYTFDGAGYLRGTRNGERVYLHRVLWEEKNGPVPKGHQLRFRDKNKENCAVENLEIVSLKEWGCKINPTGRNQYSV